VWQVCADAERATIESAMWSGVMLQCCRRTLIVGIILLCPQWSWGQQTGTPSQTTITLPELIDQALASNRNLKIAELQRGRAEHDVDGTRARQYPNFDIQFFGGYISPFDFTFQTGSFGTFPATGPVPPSVTNVNKSGAFSTYLSLQASQPLLQLKRIKQGVHTLEAERDALEERRRGLEQRIVSEVRRLYYAILENESAIAAADAGIAVSREVERLTGEQVGAETALGAELTAAKADAARREHAGLTLRNSLATLKQQMGVLIGRDLDPNVRFMPVSALPRTEIDLAAAESAAITDRPDIREAELRVRQAEASLNTKKDQRLPDVSAVGRFIGLGNIDILPSSISFVGVFVTWEPFDWGRKGQDVASSANAVSQATLALQETKAQARVDVDTRYRQLTEARALVPVAELARAAAEERLRLTRTRFDAQTALRGEVLQAEAALAEAERDYQRARLAWLTAESELQRAMGKR
jgi:outer membrane protein TolC